MSRILFIGALAAAAFALGCGRSNAMPPFAQAYGVNCTVCHTEVPGLNAYGRYVQRTGYAALDPHVLKRSLPLWFGWNPSYDSNNQPPRLQNGNVAFHAIGGIANNDWTFHIQQWITQNNQPGTLDTAWVSYNNLFNRSGHLFFGKIEAPGPSPWSQWMDLANFAPPQIVVGEHTYDLAVNRWGTRFSYVRNAIDAEVGWLGSSAGIGGSSDFANDTDKTVQWKLTDANPNYPLELGYYGARGSFPLPEGGTDRFYANGIYAQRDPNRGVPGVLFMYQTAFDGNAGGGAGPAASNAATLELYEPLFKQRAVVTARREFTNDGLGNLTQFGNVDFEYHLARFVHVYVETYLQSHQKPGYRYMLWWTTPLSSVK